MKFNTKVVRSGQEPDPLTGAVTVPIYQTATYAMEEVGKLRGWDYSRSATPTKTALEKALAAIEGGDEATVFSSGLATIDAILHTCDKGDHILACDDLYGGTTRLFTTVYKQMPIKFSIIDMTDLKLVARSMGKRTRYVFIETPSNPTLKMVDIAAVCKLAHKRNIKVIVDSTFMTPYYLKPLELGADIVLHSLTKFLSGHNDVIGGAVISNDRAFNEQMKFLVKSIGATLGPLDSYLTLRGLKTLAVRMERINENAWSIAEFLSGHPKVKRVLYPGLLSHPQYEIGRSQMTGAGGMISFELKGGVKAGRKCLNAVKLWLLAESLGGCDSLITHPPTMTHVDVPRKDRLALGISDGFIRLSVGIEDVRDLIADLKQAIG